VWNEAPATMSGAPLMEHLSHHLIEMRILRNQILKLCSNHIDDFEPDSDAVYLMKLANVLSEHQDMLLSQLHELNAQN